jgi:hypothetical protein
MKVLDDFMGRLSTGDPVEFYRLKIMPIFVDEDRKLPFVDLEEALKQGFVEITETSEAGNVPDLEVSNKSQSDVIILDGEELIGAKQNRIVNTTIVVAATTKITIPVSCVEQRRWHYTSDRFSSSSSVAYSSLRRKKYDHVTRSLRCGGGYTTDQSAIWGDIEGKIDRLNVASPNAAMADIYESSVDRTDAGEEMRKEIPHLEKQVGFLAFIDNSFAGGEVFGSADLCGRKLQKLLRSYYLDSLDAAIKFPAITVEQIFAQLQGAQHQQFEAVGKGKELRFEAEDVQGAWKLVDDLIPHLIVFPRGSEN